MANHHFTQQSAGSGRVSTADYVDEINIINELRQIVEDLAIIVGQSKLGDGNYPADGTAGVLADNVKKCNYEAVAIPTVDDDSDEGYSKGSFWIYDEEAYICVDATVGAAVWKQITYYEELS
jgi:hypothetical protein